MLDRLRRRKRRRAQNGVQAIFSTKPRGYGKLSFYRPEEDRIVSLAGTSRLRLLRSLVVVSLIVIAASSTVGLTVIQGGSFSSGSNSQGGSISPPVRVPQATAPRFEGLSNVPEIILPYGENYSGTVGVSAGDLLIVQVAYSEGSSGNLPDITRVSDSLSTTYSRVGDASPGVAVNFWEQVWTGRANASSSLVTATVRPDWAGCVAPCVSSIIIAMTFGLYHNAAEVGGLANFSSVGSSSSQAVNVTVSGQGSVIVELLSHGASNNCALDPAIAVAGQTSRNCFMGTTERTEFFDRDVSGPGTYMESYTWGSSEVQRGIYLELAG